MQAVFPNCGFRLPSLSAFKSTLGKSFLYENEIADGALLTASRRDLLQSSVSSINSEGNRRGHPPRQNTSSDRAAKEDKERKVSQSSDDEASDSSNQEEIIALFRRIQSSISKGESVSTKKKSSKNLKEKQSAESVLEVLRKYPSRKQVRDKGSLSLEEDKTLPRRRGATKKEQRTEDATIQDSKLARQVSNFVKRSLIPLPSTPKEKVSEATGERSEASVAEEVLDSHRLDEMKLYELKELARSRGLKGYSKMKKGELVVVLKELL